MAGIDELAAVMGRDNDLDAVERDKLCDEAAAEIRRFRRLLLAGLALHGGQAFTDSEREWREEARAALGINSTK